MYCVTQVQPGGQLALIQSFQPGGLGGSTGCGRNGKDCHSYPSKLKFTKGRNRIFSSFYPL